ncbi:ParB/RepB/Spo0J family partition protein [Streptomyces sp. KS 21]|uniref:ParB/RepB/Spo0J family partition protein n=1 Tax=Streptomyces sp. KS 21 TaxID=2485150 RepID=UPI001063F783|nr:ParB/RepB/Spo0J family partition protein [Streptomyces sp. KS 21]TDU67922.1 ParB family chromosome partitioning protein [Streptomyces sp. KS 21]
MGETEVGRAAPVVQTVELERLAHNPFNPRSRTGDLTETVQSLRSTGQVQALTVVRREAFLTVHTGQEAALGGAAYVVLDGNRRLAAAHAAGLPALRVDVRDDLAPSRAALLEAALVANMHRLDLRVMEQARAVQELVREHGHQRLVARQLGKTPAWVSQRLKLLDLAPDLQELVESGELKVKDARRIGAMSPMLQHAAAEQAMSSGRNGGRGRGRSGRPAAYGSAPGGLAHAINPVNAPGAAADAEDPVTRFGEYVERAVDFADSMHGIASAYRAAATADQHAADALVARIFERLERVTRHLPPPEPPSTD